MIDVDDSEGEREKPMRMQTTAMMSWSGCSQGELPPHCRRQGVSPHRCRAQRRRARSWRLARRDGQWCSAS